MMTTKNGHASPTISIDDAGWNFDNTYARLPDIFYTKQKPLSVRAPRIVIINFALAKELGLDFNACTEEELAQFFSGNRLPKGTEPLAQAYAGHQFGHFTYLGDGRAHLIGEHIIRDGAAVDIQFKGSGQTPYARRGDGRAALGPMLREYIISEAMHALGIPTTRSLAVVSSGDPVYRETPLQGAILTRIASSHLRVGTFQYLAVQGDENDLKLLADYAIKRHYPEVAESEEPYLDFLKAVINRQAQLIAKWLGVGFIHGVMNTDNMAISGETIDYGPCAFMDRYDPRTVLSSIDHNGRYAYANQPDIAQWNLARFAESLLPLLHDDIKKSASIAEETVQSFGELFQREWLAVMRCKLGLWGEEKKDEDLVIVLLQWMQRHEADYTNTFNDLTGEKNFLEGSSYQDQKFKDWHESWRHRRERNSKPFASSLCLMRANNPVVIPRNHRVEAALCQAEQESDFSKLHELLAVLSEPYRATPYKEGEKYSQFKNPPLADERVLQTFCGT